MELGWQIRAGLRSAVGLTFSETAAYRVNKASYKEGCIVNLLGVKISQDVSENKAENQKQFRVGNKVANRLGWWDAVSGINGKPPDTDLSYLKARSPINLSLILPLC